MWGAEICWNSKEKQYLGVLDQRFHADKWPVVSWGQLGSSVLFQVKGWLPIRSDDRSNNKWRDTGRASETPSLDGAFRDPPWTLCSGPCLQVITSTSYWEPCQVWAKWGVKQMKKWRKLRKIINTCVSSCVCQWAVMRGCVSGCVSWRKQDDITKWWCLVWKIWSTWK